MKRTNILMRLLTLCVAAMFSLQSFAIGWPANHHGVMLQGFWWDSYEASQWTEFTRQCDELSTYFNLIWVPNSGYCGGYNNMGYMPIYWFSNHNSSFGTEAQLRAMIAAYRAKNVGFIEDVVINHRNGKSNWTDFPSETWNGQTWQIGLDGICSDDEVNSQSGQSHGTGASDTGQHFDGARDLDHTNANVQENCKNYCKFLLTDIGYVGFRLDMVKGYNGIYTKKYNQYSQPSFCVGEYWDGYDAIANWIETAGRESAAFDFPLKFILHDAFGGDLTKLVWTDPEGKQQPAGLIHHQYRQLAVTFVDNHDSYNEDWNKYHHNVPAAYAFLMFSPGTPCVLYAHYKDYKTEIQNLIKIRNSAGISNTSPVTVLRSNASCYMAEITGDNGKAVVKVGPEMVSPSGYSNSDIKASGTDYCVWYKGNVSNNHGDDVGPAQVVDNSQPYKIYFLNESGWTTPYIYYWGGSSSPSWPGVAMTRTVGNVWEYTVAGGTTECLFNAGDGDNTKTSDMTARPNHIYNQNGDICAYEDIPTATDAYYVYFDNTATGWSTPKIHYWGATGTSWPGVSMTQISGTNIWRGQITAGNTACLFHDGNGNQTKDFVAQVGHRYSSTSDLGVYSPPATKQNQTISWDQTLPSLNVGNTFTLSAIASSGLEVTYTITDGSAYATLSGNVLTATGAGTVTVRASQDGNNNYNAATAVTRTITIARNSQTLTWNQNLTTIDVGQEITLNATASSGLAVTYVITSGSSFATINGNKLTGVNPGVVTVQAQQLGNSNYGKADPISKTITVKADYEPGDADGDGQTTVNDITRTVAYIIGTGTGTGNFNTRAADIDGDGEVTIVDVVRLLSLLLSK